MQPTVRGDRRRRDIRVSTWARPEVTWQDDVVQWRVLSLEARTEIEGASVDSGQAGELVSPKASAGILDDFCRIARRSKRGADRRALRSFVQTFGPWAACDGQYNAAHPTHAPLAALATAAAANTPVARPWPPLRRTESSASIRDSAIRLNALRRLVTRLRMAQPAERGRLYRVTPEEVAQLRRVGLSDDMRADATDAFGQEPASSEDAWLWTIRLLRYWWFECHVHPDIDATSRPDTPVPLWGTDGPAAALSIAFLDEWANPARSRICERCGVTWRGRRRKERAKWKQLCEQCYAAARRAESPRRSVGKEHAR